MSEPDLLFYDGNCGLCHRAVIFAIKRDGGAFRFAPLLGETFLTRVPENQRKDIPDSIVILRTDGALLVRSDAVIYLLRFCGIGWRVLAGIGRVVPRVFRDYLYDVVARVRGKLFAKPDDACPIVPAELRKRFDP